MSLFSGVKLHICNNLSGNDGHGTWFIEVCQGKPVESAPAYLTKSLINLAGVSIWNGI